MDYKKDAIYTYWVQYTTKVFVYFMLVKHNWNFSVQLIFGGNNILNRLMPTIKIIFTIYSNIILCIIDRVIVF